MSFDYTDIMRERLDALAASISITPGISLRGAIRELEGLRGRSIYPARYQLMQFIKDQSHTSESETSFSISGPLSGKPYTFKKSTKPEDMDDMSSEDLNNCISWLVERALSMDRNHTKNETFYNKAFSALVQKNCWVRYRESDQRFLSRVFDRHFAYEMGHMLGFSLNQMHAFLVRVLPDEIFINRDAEDLIEAYAFAHDKPLEAVRDMLSCYQALSKDCNSQYNPVDIGNTHQLYEEAVSFNGPEEDFVQWLVQRSPVLEGRSRTAFAVYANLLICAWLMMRALYENEGIIEDDPVSALWDACIVDGEDMQEYYARNHVRFKLPEYSQLDWKKIATEFNEFSEWAPSEARERRYPRDFLVYLSIDRNGEFTTENTFSRIPKIMKEGKPVQKRDVLCLLWLIYIFAWECVEQEDIYNQLHDFIDLATGILEQCNFVFYLPHLLEYSICRSIIIGGDMEDAYRSVINRGSGSPLCEDIALKAGKSGAVYGIRFYTCERYTFEQLKAILYTSLKGEKIHEYNDEWQGIELWLTKADQKLQCGWERLKDSDQISNLISLDRIIRLT